MNRDGPETGGTPGRAGDPDPADLAVIAEKKQRGGPQKPQKL